MVKNLPQNFCPEFEQDFGMSRVGKQEIESFYPLFEHFERKQFRKMTEKMCFAYFLHVTRKNYVNSFQRKL